MSGSELRALLHEAAGELSPSTQLLLMGLVQEISRLEKELAALAEDLIGDRRYSIQGGIKDEHRDTDAGPDGDLPGSPRAASVSHHDGRL